MKILYVGDIMATPGIEIVEQLLPQLRTDYDIDLVLAQAENVSEGKGITPADMQRLRVAGVNAFTAGNHSLSRPEIHDAMNDPAQPIIRPANYPVGTPGLGYKYVDTPLGKVLFMSLLGHIVGRDADKLVDNPLQVIDKILAVETDTEKIATVVNFHGDFSSEKVIIGHYLDGRASLVVGDHWHVPTADARVLPKGTAHMTDVGMCGVLDSSLGVTFDSVIPRWRDGTQTRNVMATEGPRQFNAVLVTIDTATGRAQSVEHIQRII